MLDREAELYESLSYTHLFILPPFQKYFRNFSISEMVFFFLVFVVVSLVC